MGRLGCAMGPAGNMLECGAEVGESSGWGAPRGLQVTTAREEQAPSRRRAAACTHSRRRDCAVLRGATLPTLAPRTVVLGELGCAQADHVLHALHRPGVHVGGELLRVQPWGSRNAVVKTRSAAAQQAGGEPWQQEVRACGARVSSWADAPRRCGATCPLSPASTRPPGRGTRSGPPSGSTGTCGKSERGRCKQAACWVGAGKQLGRSRHAHGRPALAGGGGASRGSGGTAAGRRARAAWRGWQCGGQRRGRAAAGRGLPQAGAHQSRQVTRLPVQLWKYSWPTTPGAAARGRNGSLGDPNRSCTATPHPHPYPPLPQLLRCHAAHAHPRCAQSPCRWRCRAWPAPGAS